MKTFGAVIDAFGGAAKFGEATGIPANHAQTMKNRNSIPSAYWFETVSAARRLGIKDVSLEKLADIAATQKRRPAQAVA